MHSIRRIAVISFALFLSSCGPPFRYDRSAHLDRVYEGNDNLYIDSPALSRDGRRLLFEFYERLSERERTRYRIALYDIEELSVRIIESPDPRIDWYHPSFKASGEAFTLISACRYQSCSPERSGANIATFDLRSSMFQVVTTSGKQEYMWHKPYGPGPLTLVPISLNRTSPVYAKSGMEVYYLGSRSIPLFERDERNFTVRKVDLSSGKDEILLNEESGVAYFVGDGSIAVSGDHGLIIFGGFGIGASRDPAFRKNEVFGYLYDTDRHEVSALLQRSDLPEPDFRRSPKTDSLSASLDGKRIAYIAGRSFELVILREGRRQRVVATLDELETQSLGDIALSGDGKRLVIFGSPLHAPGDLSYLWVIDLETGERRRLPLAATLRAAIDNRNEGNQEVERLGFRLR